MEDNPIKDIIGMVILVQMLPFLMQMLQGLGQGQGQQQTPPRPGQYQVYSPRLGGPIWVDPAGPPPIVRSPGHPLSYAPAPPPYMGPRIGG